jgi:hypothetical protein
MPRSSSSLALIALIALTVAGCFNPFHPEVSTDPAQSGQAASPPPRPTSARNLMKLFRWCWENRNISHYEELFTDDFKFGFAETDSTGFRFPGGEAQRIDEVESARHLFVGGGQGEPPAHSISFEFRSPLAPEADPRRGKEEPWHVMFQTDVDITIRTETAPFRILSKAVFYVVRGDSAILPEVLINRGFTNDRSRWYMERYEELGPAAIIQRDPRDGELRSRPAAPGERWSAVGRPGALGRDASARPGAAPEAGYPDLYVTWGWLKAYRR